MTAFPPLWDDPVGAEPERLGAEQSSPAARAAGQRLVEDIRRAERLTRGWADRPLTDALVDAALCRCLGQLVRTGCWGRANRLPSHALWQAAESVLPFGWLQHRARFKPRGYAGDYLLLYRICKEVCCDHPLGWAFDRYFLRQSAPLAVRLRTRQTSVALADHRLAHGGGSYEVLSFGSGPALDLRQALAIVPPTQRSAIHVTLVDLDPEALDFARGQLDGLLTASQFDCIRANLFRAATGPCSDDLGTPHFLVCPGLFDYLEDKDAVRMLAALWQRLAPGGLMTVGNFAPHNASRAYMEWIGNWYLVYRTPADFLRLALQAGIPRTRLTISCEPAGVNLFLVAWKS
ncbi:MAG TPA: class I SAM-dependent methyltransferase [Planctomycetes bacterium]|nr:class I SAM-dependent methyltransferase [Planctomycetota bacterium]